jgi:small multidrug resistance pump
VSPWLLLFVAILLEVVGTTCMRLIGGWDLASAIPIIGMLLAYVGSLTTVTFVIRHIDIGVTYAIWSGIGTVATALIGYSGFGEPLSYYSVLCMALIIAGVVGLNLSRPPR